MTGLLSKNNRCSGCFCLQNLCNILMSKESMSDRGEFRCLSEENWSTNSPGYSRLRPYIPGSLFTGVVLFSAKGAVTLRTRPPGCKTDITETAARWLAENQSAPFARKKKRLPETQNPGSAKHGSRTSQTFSRAFSSTAASAAGKDHVPVFLHMTLFRQTG